MNLAAYLHNTSASLKLFLKERCDKPKVPGWKLNMTTDRSNGVKYKSWCKVSSRRTKSWTIKTTDSYIVGSTIGTVAVS